MVLHTDGGTYTEKREVARGEESKLLQPKCAGKVRKRVTAGITANFGCLPVNIYNSRAECRAKL